MFMRPAVAGRINCHEVIDMRFALLGGDRRCVYLYELLRADGHAVTPFALERALPDCAPDAAAAVAGAEVILLPVPCEKNGALFAPFSAAARAVSPLLTDVAPGTRVFAGGAPECLRAACRRGGLPLTDYLRREDFALRNADITAEAALALLMQGDGALRGQRVLLAGFGRIARCLAPKLLALGAEVTVWARRPEARTQAALLGCHAVRALPAGETFDAAVNTVPATIFGPAELEALGGARLLELASAPYGFDLTAAEALGKNVEMCPGLPGTYAPRAAAAAMRDVIYSVLED